MLSNTEIATSIVLGTLVVGGLSFVGYSYYDLNKSYNNAVTKLSNNTCDMYDSYNQVYKQNLAHPEGVYWVNTDFYCVWAKDRPLSIIEDIERHEYAHYLINENYNHFCGVDAQ